MVTPFQQRVRVIQIDKFRGLTQMFLLLINYNGRKDILHGFIIFKVQYMKFRKKKELPRVRIKQVRNVLIFFKDFISWVISP